MTQTPAAPAAGAEIVLAEPRGFCAGVDRAVLVPPVSSSRRYVAHGS